MRAHIRERRAYMMDAFLYLHARRMPQETRERWCWAFLLLWASLGGTQDEVIR